VLPFNSPILVALEISVTSTEYNENTVGEEVKLLVLDKRVYWMYTWRIRGTVR
jgi:hypothetical protein